jgi:hypothetical protein
MIKAFGSVAVEHPVRSQGVPCPAVFVHVREAFIVIGNGNGDVRDSAPVEVMSKAI